LYLFFLVELQHTSGLGNYNYCMRNLLYIYKILVIRRGKYRFAFFLPWIGIAVGTFMLLLTDAIMSGMENEIFSSLNEIEKDYYVEGFSDADIDNLSFYLNKNNINYELVDTRDVIISHDEDYMLVKMVATNNELNRGNTIVIGEGIANHLGVSENDSISIFSPLDISFSTLKVPNINYMIDSIYATPVVGFDNKYVFTCSSTIEGVIASDKKISIMGKMTDSKLEEFRDTFKDIKISYWKDNYLELISAIKLEKLMYGAFAYMLILISCLGSFTITNFIITNKLSELSMLNILGLNLYKIKKILTSLMLGSTIIATIGGCLLLYLLIYLGVTNSLISILFPHNLFYNFIVTINIEYLLIILVINIVTVYFSSLIAINIISKTQLIDILKGNNK
tara:strand:+ start:2452 stop:3633 length:1182 start_codon:yes stop_codon:yes gene_type:complete